MANFVEIEPFANFDFQSVEEKAFYTANSKLSGAIEQNDYEEFADALAEIEAIALHTDSVELRREADTLINSVLLSDVGKRSGDPLKSVLGFEMPDSWFQPEA